MCPFGWGGASIPDENPPSKILPIKLSTYSSPPSRPGIRVLCWAVTPAVIGVYDDDVWCIFMMVRYLF